MRKAEDRLIRSEIEFAENRNPTTEKNKWRAANRWLAAQQANYEAQKENMQRLKTDPVLRVLQKRNFPDFIGNPNLKLGPEHIAEQKIIERKMTEKEYRAWAKKLGVKLE